MKALKSERATTLLADPSARSQLRIYLADRVGSQARMPSAPVKPAVIEIRSQAGDVVRFRPVVVPKAA